jgi:hypothetical protein
MTALDHALKRSEKILASKGASKHACRFTTQDAVHAVRTKFGVSLEQEPVIY